MIAFNTYDIGDVVRCSAVFKTAAGVLIDPSSLVFKLLTPSGTTLMYTYGVGAEVVRSTTGTYYADVVVQQEGAYWYRFEGSGTAYSAQESHFCVRQSLFY